MLLATTRVARNQSEFRAPPLHTSQNLEHPPKSSSEFGAPPPKSRSEFGASPTKRENYACKN